MTKRAVNRVADAAGFRTALYAGLDVVGSDERWTPLPTMSS